jgi:DNA-binding transcriptional LysR family regulator
MLQIGGVRLAIKALPVSLPDQHRNVAIVTLKGRSLSPAAQLFIECAREVAKPLVRQTLTGRGRSGNLPPRSTNTK